MYSICGNCGGRHSEGFPCSRSAHEAASMQHAPPSNQQAWEILKMAETIIQCAKDSQDSHRGINDHMSQHWVTLYQGQEQGAYKIRNAILSSYGPFTQEDQCKK